MSELIAEIRILVEFGLMTELEANKHIARVDGTIAESDPIYLGRNN
jgi:hypothetical protein